MIFLRFMEDAYILGRFGYFYATAPKKVTRLGFVQNDDKMPVVLRARWAWGQTMGGMQQRG